LSVIHFCDKKQLTERRKKDTLPQSVIKVLAR